MEKNKSGTKKTIFQLIKFALVGASSTLLSELIYMTVIYFGGNYLFATTLEFIISVFYSYLLNNRFVFKAEEGEHRVWWKVLLKVYASYLAGYIVNVILLYIWVDVVCFSRFMGPLESFCFAHGMMRMDAKFWGEAVAQVSNLLVTIPLNYCLNRFWAYRSEKTKCQNSAS